MYDLFLPATRQPRARARHCLRSEQFGLAGVLAAVPNGVQTTTPRVRLLQRKGRRIMGGGRGGWW